MRCGVADCCNLRHQLRNAVEASIFTQAPSKIAFKHSPLRAVYEVKCVGINGDVRYFLKPVFMTATPFVGMVWCLPVAMLHDYRKSKKGRSEADGASQPLLGGNGEASNVRVL